MTKVFAGMAASLDGYIQSKTKDLSWLNNAMARDEDYGFAETMKRTGAYVIGAITYREMAESGMAGGDDKVPTYILSHDESLKLGKNTHPYTGDLKQLIEKIKSEIPPGKDICVYGGGETVSQFADQGLLDELSISIVPVLLGEGTPFFTRISGWKKLKLLECKPFKSGIVVLKYEFSK